MAIYTNKEWDDVHMTKEINQRTCGCALASGGTCVEFATDEGNYCPAHQAEYARNKAEASAFDERTMRAHWLNEAAAIAPAGTHVGELVSVANWIIDGGEGW